MGDQWRLQPDVPAADMSSYRRSRPYHGTMLLYSLGLTWWIERSIPNAILPCVMLASAYGPGSSGR